MSNALFLLHTDFRPWVQALLQVANQYRLNPKVTSTYRSLAEQAELYREYLAGRHPYPVAPPGRSLHNYGLAADIVCDDLPWLGQVWQNWGGYWSPADDIHFAAPIQV